MQFGIVVDFRNPALSAESTTVGRRHYPQLYQELLDQVVLAEQLGFGHAWLSEHHFTDEGYNPSVLPAAAAIAARTSALRIGTFVLVLPFHDPVRVAEDVTFVDILSNGRFDLGVGQGYTQDEYRILDLDRRRRGAHLEESLELITRLWTERDVEFEGRFSQVYGATLEPRPIQQPHPPIWIGARGPKAIDRAARLGANLLTTIGPDPAPEYVDALRKHRRDPSAFQIGQLRLMYCAPTEQQAWDEVSLPLHLSMSYYGKVMAEAGDLAGDDRIWTFEDHSEIRGSGLARAALIGTPDQVHARLENLLERVHCSELILAAQLPGLDPAKANASLELFASEVMPAFAAEDVQGRPRPT